MIIIVIGCATGVIMVSLATLFICMATRKRPNFTEF